MNDTIRQLLDLTSSAVSPFHAAEYAAGYLDRAGFYRLTQSEKWEITPGGKYYLPLYGTTVLAFTVGTAYAPGDMLRVAAAHTDWPCFRIKPSPEIVSGGCCRLNIEPYGGMILNTWLDRPLSVAGSVLLKTDDPMVPSCHLVNWENPILTIPNLAIHLNRDVNKGVELNAHKDMLPLCRTISDKWSKDGYFLGVLADKLGVSPEEILSYDLSVYNAESGCTVGLCQDMVSSPRLDNLSSAMACLKGITGAERCHGINAVVLFDHEEVGSRTKQGADSSLLSMMLEKLCLSLRLGRSDYLDTLTGGFLLSCDVAHAVHPKCEDIYDPTCQARMNGGVAIKMTYSQNYPTDAGCVAVIEGLCRDRAIPYQHYMNRADKAAGSTIGVYAATGLGMRTVDVGVPILAMHSSRELMGAEDQASLTSLVTAFLSQD